MNTYRILSILVVLLFAVPVFSQDEAKKEKGEPVDETFNSSTFMDNQTVMSCYKGRPELNIQHRFSGMQNKMADLFGLYGASNIRLALSYGVTDDIMIGFGYEKFNKIAEIYGKYAILRQTDNNSMPVSVSYFGCLGFDTHVQDTVSLYFGNEYHFTNRLVYFNQLIIARKFNDRVSAQIAPSYSHYNWLKDTTMVHGYFGMHVAAKVNVRGAINAMVEYDHPIAMGSVENMVTSKPNLAAGLEFATGTHGLQVFVGSADQLIFAANYVKNTKDFTDGGLALGFNVNIKF